MRPTDETQPKVFSPPDERTQSLLGATLLGIYLASGVEVIAEDLGTVPDFVRWSMARLGVPGFKVLRWERAWREPEEPLLDPAAYPERVGGAVGHPRHRGDDRVVGRGAGAAAGRRCAACAGCRWQRQRNEPYVPVVRDAVLRTLLASGSRYVMFPLQDVFGWDDARSTRRRR